ncbi:MAG: DUF805 domain-containing protein [Gammaproteobacteria bacterium]|nr:DUF805 domain-containing protein [Gammaproteobacteria bacterium]
MKNEAIQTRNMMDFGTAIKTCFRKYADFSGRATRAEYWWFVLFVVLVSLGLGVIDCSVLGSGCDIDTFGYGALSWLWILAILLPDLAVGARRLHDIGRSGWWLLLWAPSYFWMLLDLLAEPSDREILDILAAIGLLFAIPIIVMACFRTWPETNRYGDPAQPKQGNSEG